MVQGYLSPAQQLAAGIRALPGAGTTWAAVQGAYRFLNNPRLTLRTLLLPLLEAAHEAVPKGCDSHVLAVHDWSLVKFRRHASKEDRMAVGKNPWKEGYELHSCLLVSDRAGDPLAPVSLALHAADGVHCTRSVNVRPALSVLDELDPIMSFVEQQAFSKPVVHIVDAEADSVAHYRLWSTRAGRQYLVRADDRLVEHEGQERRCAAVQELLRQQGCFAFSREIHYHGRPARQYVAEATVRLTRPGQQNRADGSQARVPGPPLSLRLVIAEVRAVTGELLATWYLLTNVCSDVPAATVALWYYWRWRVETFFKLLKSAGFNLEDWRQESAGAIARRLLVASMACVIVWQLARNTAPEAEETRRFLVRLSGRQMARGKSFTEPALLAGLWMLLNLQHVLETYDETTLRRMIALALPSARAGPS